MNPKTIDEYCRFLKDTRWYVHAGEHNAPELSYLTLGLAGEAGEFTDEVKKIVRECGFANDKGFVQLMQEPGHRTKLLNELGDVLWYITNLAMFLGESPVSLMVYNTYKLHNRLTERSDLPTPEWPFSDPFLSYDNAQEVIEGGRIQP